MRHKTGYFIILVMCTVYFECRLSAPAGIASNISLKDLYIIQRICLSSCKQIDPSQGEKSVPADVA